MDSLILAPTRSTPAVSFNASEGSLLFEGKSAPEHVMQFFDPLFQWLNTYMATGGPVILNAKFTYFNTSSSKALLDLFEMLAAHNDKYGNVTVNWYYEPDDDDMKESGEEFADDTNMEFNFIAVEK